MKAIVYFLATTALLSLAACTEPGVDQTGSTSPKQGIVKGRVTDSQGNPVANAQIVASSTDYHNKTTTGYTDASGNYSFALPTGIAEGSYSVSGTVTLKYHGQDFTLALYEENSRVFSAYDGAVRNFVFRLTGKRTADSENDPQRSWPLGGRVEVHCQHDNIESDNLELTFEPVGPLVDGSAGRTLVKTLPRDGYHIYDIPVGQYKITARDHVTGQKLGVTIKDSFKDYAPSVVGLFQPADFAGDTRYELILLVNTL